MLGLERRIPALAAQDTITIRIPEATEQDVAITSQKIERWEAAQTKENGFWKREGVLEPQMARVLSRYKPFIDSVAGELSPDAAVLDIGCGPTCAGQLFPVRKLVFLDPLMDSYRETYGSLLPRGELITARAEDIPKPAASFDVVFSVNALDHMADPDTVLSEVRRVLKPRGIFLLGLFLHSEPIAVIRKVIDRFLPFAREDAHPYSYTRRTAQQLLARHFELQREVVVFRKNEALVPALHREDRMFVCGKRDSEVHQV